MASKFGVPPQGEVIRGQVEQRLAEASKTNGETVTVDFRDGSIHLRVISMPVEMLYYNPDTHRIRAQRSLDPVKNAALTSEPWGSIAQQYLELLLKSQPSEPGKIDPDFEALRDNLKDFGQKEAGLITSNGILVNGNTRCAALREIGHKHIRVGVLPGDATWDDINSVELSLQLRKHHKREYSYINRLIAIDEQSALGRKEEDIAKEFHIQVKTLRQDRWVFGVIQEMISRSATPEGFSLRLVDFEDHQEKLRELHRAYEKEASTNRDAAEALKESRLAMLVLEQSKTDLRLAESNFHAKYLDAKLPEALRPGLVTTTGEVGIPGLGITVAEPSQAAKTTKSLTDSLLKARATAQASKAQPDKAAAAKDLLKTAKDAVDRALDAAGRDARLKVRKLAPTERLSDACDDLALCISDVAQAAATRALSEDSFDQQLVRLRDTLERLAKQAARAFEKKDAEGIAWLLALGEAPRE